MPGKQHLIRNLDPLPVQILQCSGSHIICGADQRVQGTVSLKQLLGLLAAGIHAERRDGGVLRLFLQSGLPDRVLVGALTLLAYGFILGKGADITKPLAALLNYQPGHIVKSLVVTVIHTWKARQVLAHCVARLRLVTVDNSKIDMKALENVDGVKGVFSSNGQLQLILGTGTVNKVYDEFLAVTGMTAATKDEVKAGEKLIAFDRAKIAAAGHPDVVVVLVTNSDDYEDLTIQPGSCGTLKPVIQVK